MARIQQDRVQAHPPRPRLPEGRGLVRSQAGQLLPALPAVARAVQGRVLDPRVNRVRIVQRGLQMPDPHELEGPRRAVVPQMRAGLALVDELVPHRLPRLAPVIGALDQLPVPACVLRGIQAIRINGRALEVIEFPAPEEGAAHVPPVALAIRRKHERALSCADQYPYPAHLLLLSEICADLRSKPGLFLPLYSRTGRPEIDITPRLKRETEISSCGNLGTGSRGVGARRQASGSSSRISLRRV